MNKSQPLADILRPKTLDDVIGQEHLVGKNGIFQKMLAAQFLPSMIFWGPPGCGKTTLARILARSTHRQFFEFSAVNTKITDITAAAVKEPLIFIDEIHRFNKAQQDKLLPYVERGQVLLIGATTENPSFEVIAPLLSRCRVLVLKQLSEIELRLIAKKGLQYLKRKIDKDAEDFLIEISNGDARNLLTILEIAASIQGQTKDKGQALNKKRPDPLSMRASDVDASLYYLARMVAAGEDPLFIARRMVVFASEDVSSPTALVVANAVFAACHAIGYPECQENLASGVVYLCNAKKDRSAYDAYFRALDDVKKYGNLPINYHPYTTESLLPDRIKGTKYFRGGEKG